MGLRAQKSRDLQYIPLRPEAFFAPGPERNDMTATDDAEARVRIRAFREPILLILVALVMISNVLPRNWVFGVRTKETMASDTAWVAGNRIGGLAMIGASVVWLLAAAYLPRPYVKPVGVAALLLVVGLLFVTQGWSF